jgi:translocation and assembly module TamB
LSIRPDLVLRAKNFEVLSGPQHFAAIDGEVRVHGDDEGSIIVDSDITVNRSRFYLPSLQVTGTAKDQDPPMLVVAAGRVDTGSAVRRDSAARGIRVPQFRGKATLRILRGTWLRGPRLNVELSGNLEISPEGSSMAVRGFLMVEQGSYEFYGRKFVFKQGRIDFDGGTRIDPSVYFEVEYTFRTDAGENQMLIVVRGRSEKPDIQFFFNKDRITESDAISYIIFGRKVDDLNYGQKSTVADLGNALALDLAANMVNAQLSSMVGDQLGLDVVRVSGEDNWNKAVLTAGKYVTDELFVAYERGISQSGSSSVVFESARMEYYLMKFLYLHLIEATDKTSGIDVFLKFD